MLSVVVPIYDEAECIREFACRLRSHLDQIGEEYEVLLVDDGSTDSSGAIITSEILVSWKAARYIRFTRNFGHMAAIECGLRHSRGDLVVMLDADLQHPPEEIARMLGAMRHHGVDVVQMVRQNRDEDPLTKRFGSRLFYWLGRRMSGVHITQGAADYRLISSRVRDALMDLPEKDKVYRLLIPWMGFPTVELEFIVPMRYAGSSKYTLLKMLTLARSGFATFGFGLLRFIALVGLLVGMVGLLAVAFVVGSWISGNTVSGWASITSALLFLGGIQLLMTGLIGEYLIATLSAARARPDYVVLEEVVAPYARVNESDITG